jgi:hypothetical protein
MFEAADEDARQPAPDTSRFDPGRTFEQHAENDLCLEPGERGTNAEVCTLAERDVALPLGPIQSKFIRVVKLQEVPIGRAPQQQQTGSRSQLDAAKGGVAQNVSVVATEGWFVA